MSGKLSSILVAVGMLSVLLFSGCNPSADLSLKFSPDHTTAYKATSEVIRSYRFEQPNFGKLKEEQNEDLIEMSFTQTIQSVDADGNATARITINALKVDIIKKNKTKLSFDSQNEKDQNAPMAKLLGQSYTIKITPSGTVEVLDTKKAIAAVTSKYEKGVATLILNSNNVANRHGVPALPKNQTTGLSVESSWSNLVPPLPDMFAPKSYEKTYTRTAIDDTIATIQMNAGESADPAEGVQPNMLNALAKMFDNTDDYTGTLKIDLATGEVLKSDETLVSISLMQEMPENADPEKGPDTLTMQFIHRIQLEKLD